MNKKLTPFILMASALMLAGFKATAQSSQHVTVGGSVYGGGNLAPVSGNTSVLIDQENAVVEVDVYGGGAFADVGTDGNNTTTVDILDGTITGDIYGGGLGDASHVAKVYGVVTVNIGTGIPGATVTDLPTGVSGSATIGGNVYGCNNANGSPQEDVTVNIFQTAHETTNFANYTGADATYAIANVFGGGNQADYSVDKDAHVNVYTCDNTIGRVFGGGNAAATNDVNTMIQGGRINQVFGGGNGEVTAADVDGSIDLSIHGGDVGQFYGASNTSGAISGSISVEVNNDGPCGNLEIDYFFCGGNLANITGDLTTTLHCGAGEMQINNLYGGCNQANITGDVVLNVEGGTYENVFGGSRGTSTAAANIDGNVTLNLYGGTIGNAFGGSDVKGNITGTITVNVLDKEGSCPLYVTNIYGGSNLTNYTPTGTVTSPVVNVVHIKSGVSGNVYGGSKGVEGATGDDVTKVAANPLVNIGYHADMNGYITPTSTYLTNYSALLDAPRAIISGSVFGGGDAAKIEGNTAIFLRNKAKVFGNVYGGGNMGVVTGNTKVIVNGAIE